MPILLDQWGLMPRFKRWRLAQDPETGTVVLFGVLNNKYIATHTTTPFSDYFDPRLLRDLASALHVPVISSANDGLRYAFILEKGELGPSPDDLKALEHYPVEQEPFKDPADSLVAVPPEPVEPPSPVAVEDGLILHQRLDKFLQIAKAIDELNATAPQPVPADLLMEEAEFFQHLAEYETKRKASAVQVPNSTGEFTVPPVS
jgi:hypothetical protein